MLCNVFRGQIFPLIVFDQTFHLYSSGLIAAILLFFPLWKLIKNFIHVYSEVEAFRTHPLSISSPCNWYSFWSIKLYLFWIIPDSILKYNKYKHSSIQLKVHLSFSANISAYLKSYSGAKIYLIQNQHTNNKLNYQFHDLKAHNTGHFSLYFHSFYLIKFQYIIRLP